MPLIFQAKLPPDITYWHHTHFWRKQLCENALSSATLTRDLTLTNGSLGAEGVEECWYPRCWAVTVLTNHPRYFPDLCGLHHESPGQEPVTLAMLPAAGRAFGVWQATLTHRGIFLWEQIHLPSLSVALQQGQGKVESSSTWISFLLPMFVPFCLSGTLIPGLAILQEHQACVREATAVFPRQH